MASNDITLTHSSVNGGTAVKIFGGSVQYAWKNLTKSEPVNGKYDVVEAHYGGFENPRIVINGFFDADNQKNNNNYMTQKLLVDFATLKSGTITLKAQAGSINESGTTTGTTSNKLVDSGAAFPETLVGIMVLNTTDNTSAIVTAVDSSTQLTLSDDIFTSGEAYVIANVIGGRPSGGYDTAGGNSLDIENGVDVQIDSFNVNFSSFDSDQGQRVNFSITMHETA